MGGYFCFKKPDAGQVLQRLNLDVRFMQALIVRSDVFIACTPALKITTIPTEQTFLRVNNGLWHICNV